MVAASGVRAPLCIVELDVAIDPEPEFMTTCVIITLPVIVLVPEGPLPVSVMLLLPEALATFFAVVKTVVTVTQVEAGVEIVVVHDEVIGYPAAASSICHVEQLVIVTADATVQDWMAVVMIVLPLTGVGHGP